MNQFFSYSWYKTQHVADNLTHSSILTVISFIIDLKLGYNFVNHIDPDIPKIYVQIEGIL